MQEDAVTDTRDDRPLVLRACDDGVLTLTLNRGERFNPLSSAMIAALDAELEAAACDASTRGRARCCGQGVLGRSRFEGDARVRARQELAA